MTHWIPRIARWLGLTNPSNEEVEPPERFGPETGPLEGLVKPKFRCGVCSNPVEKEGQLCCEMEPTKRRELQKGYPHWDQEPITIKDIEEMEKKTGYYAGGCSSRALLEWRERDTKKDWPNGPPPDAT